jgi:hypothetical protein
MLAKLGIPVLALAVALGFMSKAAAANDGHHGYGYYGRGYGGNYGGFYTPYYSPYYYGYGPYYYGHGPYFYGYPYSGGFGFYFAPHHHH